MRMMRAQLVDYKDCQQDDENLSEKFNNNYDIIVNSKKVGAHRQDN